MQSGTLAKLDMHLSASSLEVLPNTAVLHPLPQRQMAAETPAIRETITRLGVRLDQ